MLVVTESLYEFLEVVWCIITVGAFCKVQALREKEKGQGEEKWSKSTMFDQRFIVLAAMPLLMHLAMTFIRYIGEQDILNTAVLGLGYLVCIIVFMIVSWLVVLRLIQNGIDQVREEKEALQNAEPEQTLAEGMPEGAS